MKKSTVLIVLALSLTGFAVHANAASFDSSGLLDTILASFSNVASTWQAALLGYATWLFWGLVLLSMTWTYGMMFVKGGGLQEALAETIRFFATTGFFFYLLQHGPTISIAIIDTMRQLGAQATGLANNLSPSGIVDVAFGVLQKTREASSLWSPMISMLMLVEATIVLVVLALVGVNMLLLLISGWMLAYAGVFLLGFGGGRWTSDIAINYYRTVLGIAVQIFTMILLVGIGRSFIDQFYVLFLKGKPDLNSLCVLLVAAIVLLVLVNKVPPMLAGIVGGSTHSSGIGNFGAAAAVGAASMAASALATAGSAAMASGVSVAGGMSALSAAFTSAQENMANNDGAFDSGGTGSDSGDQSGNGKSGSAFAQAMGTAGRFAADVASNIATGAGQVASEASRTGSGLVADRIAGTVGGKVANAIKSGRESRSFGGDEISGVSTGSFAQSVHPEVAAFVGKNNPSE